MPLLESTPRGLYCAAGDFYIDPFRAVDRAIVTHGHSDHARPGSRFYLTSRSGAAIVRERLGAKAHIEGVEFGQRVTRDGVTVSFHPAGHLLGSAQIRVEHKGEVWVASGDYKTERDPTCEPFEPVRCHSFITESTFALPLYRWRPQSEIFADMNAWRAANAAEGFGSVLFAYSLGKSQRLLAGMDSTITPIVLDKSVAAFLPIYEAEGIYFPEYSLTRDGTSPVLAIAPPGIQTTEWFKQLGPVRTAFASGWMHLRKGRRSRRFDRGFPLSDHADWDGLLETIDATGAEQILVTHGFTKQFVQYLRERGKNARVLPTHFEYAAGETEEEQPEE